MRKIKIHPSFIIVWLLFLLSDKSAYILFLFLAALLHETAHMCVFLLRKAELEEIKILPFGISVRLKNAAVLSYTDEILAALAGPAANGAAALLLSFLREAQVGGLQFFLLCNIALAAVNMLPIYPLDGGRAVFFHLCAVKNPIAAKSVSLWLSVIFLLPLFVCAVWLLFATGYNFSLLLIVFYLLFYLLFKKY